MKFNIDNYTGKYIMHCKTEEEAKDFCDYMNSIGHKTCCNNEYRADTLWSFYGKELAFAFNLGSHCELSWYKTHWTEYTILEWEDFMNKEFTKADLKTGDVILRRDGDVEIAIKELRVLLRNDGDYNRFGDINNDLTSIYEPCRDIIAVRRPTEDFHCTFSAFTHKRGILVYDREREEVDEMTLAEVCKLLGKNIKIVR